MPQIFTFGEFVIFFWTGENDEPVHVHVAVKRPQPNATKFWLTQDGGCILANNNSRISNADLRDLAKLIRQNHTRICKAWIDCFGDDSLRFYR